MNENTIKIKGLIKDEVCLGTYGLVELELLDLEKKIEKLKELEKYYQVAMDWYYRKKYYEDEYLQKIGSYNKYTPEEIAEEIMEDIKAL